MLIGPAEALVRDFVESKYSAVFREPFSFPPKNIIADYSSNLPVALGKKLGRPPQEIFAEISAAIDAVPEVRGTIEKLEFLKGFMNLTFTGRYLASEAAAFRTRPDVSDLGVPGESVNIEFVSANPTGPLHAGHGRCAVIGNSLANLFESTGAKVVREYYVNDKGNQVEVLLESVRESEKKLKGEPSSAKEGLYKGEYIDKLAGQTGGMSDAETREFLVREILSMIKADLDRLNVRFDIFSSEKALYSSGLPQKCLADLERLGAVKNEGEAKLLSAESINDDKDRVLVKSDGAPTYFLSDIAYHIEKASRCPGRLINVWGADHHGYVRRLSGALKLLGLGDDRLKVILYQMVNLIRDGQRLQLSKRAGNYVTLSSVVDEAGPDAVTYFFLSKSPDSQMDFDMELALKKTSENPVYYTQYCHARICSIVREYAKKGLEPDAGWTLSADRFGEEDLILVRTMLRYPDVVRSARKNLSCHFIVEYTYRLAEAFHRYYTKTRIITEDKTLTQDRLYLSLCVKNVIAHAFGILGLSSPEQM